MKSLSEIVKTNPEIAQKMQVVLEMAPEEQSQLLEEFLSQYPEEFATKLGDILKSSIQNPEEPLDDNNEKLVEQALLAVELEKQPASAPLSELAGRLRPTR